MNLSEIKDKVRFLTNTNSTSYTDSDLEKNINNWYKTVVTWIWQATGLWEYDDSNQTTLPVATTNLVDGQSDYSLPSDAIRVHHLEVKNNDGDWHEIPQIDKTEFPEAPSEYFDEDGMPKYYDLIADSVVLYPAPNSSDVTLTNGLRLHDSRQINTLSASGDTPGFDSSFHNILTYGAAMDYSMKDRDNQKEADFSRMIFGSSYQDGLKDDLIKEYGNRNKGRKNKIHVKKENFA